MLSDWLLPLQESETLTLWAKTFRALGSLLLALAQFFTLFA